jgi:hypothetical protein
VNPSPILLSPPPRFTPTSLSGGGKFVLGRDRRWPATVKGGVARHTAAACSSLRPSFFSCLSPSSLALAHVRSRESCAPWQPGEAGDGAAAGPLAGACVHPWVSAPPSSGSVSAPFVAVQGETAQWCGLPRLKRTFPVECAGSGDGGGKD